MRPCSFDYTTYHNPCNCCLITDSYDVVSGSHCQRCTPVARHYNVQYGNISYTVEAANGSPRSLLDSLNLMEMVAPECHTPYLAQNDTSIIPYAICPYAWLHTVCHMHGSDGQVC